GRGWPTSCSKSELVWPAACVSSSGAITLRCSSSLTTSPPIGFSICGTRHRPRRRRSGCVRSPSSGLSKRTACAVGRLPRFCASSNRSRCRSHPGWSRAASDHIRTLTVRIRLVNQQLKAAHRKLDELCAQLIPSEENEPGQRCEQRDVVILRSMPGLGRIILAALLAEVWQPLRRRDYHALRSLSGVAPVTSRSGKTCVVVRRYACNKRLANALYHWARLATQHDALSRRRYAALRQRGHSHGRALRTVADRLLSVACTLLE